MGHQSGNVLFYILIAVALLAALSYAVAQGGRSSLSGLTEEKSRLYAGEILEYADSISNAVSQLKLRGYTDTQISFENNIVSGYVNSNCSEDFCRVFALDGGGVNYMSPKVDWLDSTFSSQLRYAELYFHGHSHVEDVGTGDDDLVLFIPYLKKELCMALNDLLGIEPTGRDVPLETNGPFAVNIKYTGAFVQVVDRKVSGDGTTGQTDILYGKQAGCTMSSGGASNPSAGTYHFFKVLIPR